MRFFNQQILLVEDDANDALFFQHVLRRTRNSKPVQVVCDGTEAVAYLNGEGLFADRARHPLPGIIFLDINLPKMTGFEVLTWIRLQRRWKKIPVIVLAGSESSIDVYRSYELGANSYLVKPVDSKALDALADKLGFHSLLLPDAAGHPSVPRRTPPPVVEP